MCICGGGDGGSCVSGGVSVKSLKEGCFLHQSDAKLPIKSFSSILNIKLGKVKESQGSNPSRKYINRQNTKRSGRSGDPYRVKESKIFLVSKHACATHAGCYLLVKFEAVSAYFFQSMWCFRRGVSVSVTTRLGR